MDTRVLPCVRCGHTTLAHKAHRAQPLPREHRERCANGMCRRCRRETNDPPTRAPAVPRAVVLEDWHWLHETGELDPAMPLAHRVALAAPRIGMSADALDRALYRAGIRNPVGPRTERAA